MKPNYLIMLFILVCTTVIGQPHNFCNISPFAGIKNPVGAEKDAILTYDIKHDFTLNPDTGLKPQVYMVSYNHAFVIEPIMGCLSAAVMPPQQPIGFEEFCIDTIIIDAAYNCYDHGGVGVDTVIRIVGDSGLTNADSAIANTCYSPAMAYTCIHVGPPNYDAVNGSIHSFGFAQAINNDKLTESSAFSWSGVSFKDDERLLKGEVVWTPDFESSHKSKIKSIRQKAGTNDPIVYNIYDSVTGLTYRGTLLSIVMRYETAFDTLLHLDSWQDDSVHIESDSLLFQIIYPSPFTSKQGELMVHVKNGQIFQVLKSGVFASVFVPPPGTPVPFSFALNNTLQFHYNLDSTGLFGNHPLAINIFMYGNNENGREQLEDTTSLLAKITKPSCYNQCNGGINLYPNYGVGPYTFLWSNGSTTEDLTLICAGTYTVTVIDFMGHMRTDSFFVAHPSAMTIFPNIQHVTCRGSHDGKLYINTSGGTPPYTYQWSNGKTNKNLIGLYPKTYTVTVTDASGCTKTGVYVITQAAQLLTLSITKKDVNCFGKCTGWIKVNRSGGVAPFTYAWNTGASTSTITNVCAGTYTCTVTDAYGCTKTISSTILQNPSIIVTVTTVPPDGALATSIGGVPPYTYTWNTIPPQMGPLATGLLSGQTYKVTIRDSLNCVKNKFYTVPGSRQFNKIELLLNLPKVFPNPTSGSFTITSGQLPIEEIQLIDANGKPINLIHEVIPAESEIGIDLSNYANGIYCLKMISSKEVIIVKLVKN